MNLPIRGHDTSESSRTDWELWMDDNGEKKLMREGMTLPQARGAMAFSNMNFEAEFWITYPGLDRNEEPDHE